MASTRDHSQRKSLIAAVLIASLGPAIVAATGMLLRSNATGLTDAYFGFFKNSGFLLPVILGLLLSVTGALPGIVVLGESFQAGRRIVAALSVLWAVICLMLCLCLSDFA
jgi:hypothetical protein